MLALFARPRRARLLAALGVLAAVAMMTTQARAEHDDATPIAGIGEQAFALGGQVTVTLLERSASDESHLFVIDPDDGVTRVFIGSNFDPPGTMVDVSERLGGDPPEGVELIFEIENLRSHCRFQTGPAERNPDGQPHAAVTEATVNDQTVVHVAFEDLATRDINGNMPAGCPDEQFGNSDHDFNDNVFQFTGIIVNPMPSVLEAFPSIIHVSGVQIYFPNVSARLTDAGGVPIVGREIVFSEADFLLGVVGTEICRATTDSTGLASCGGLVEEIATVLGVGYEAAFAGDALWLPSDDHGPIVTVVPGLDIL
jgi:hypothetical protein